MAFGDRNRIWFGGFKVTYKTPVPTGEVYFAETFDDGSLDRCGLTRFLKDPGKLQFLKRSVISADGSCLKP